MAVAVAVIELDIFSRSNLLVFFPTLHSAIVELELGWVGMLL